MTWIRPAAREGSQSDDDEHYGGAGRALHPATGMPPASSAESAGAILAASGSLTARSRSVKGISVGVRAGTDLYLQLPRSGDSWRRTDRALCRAGGQVRGPRFSGLGPDGPIVNSARYDELHSDRWAGSRLRPAGEGSRMGLWRRRRLRSRTVPRGRVLSRPARGRAAVRCRLAVVAAGTVAPVTGKASRRCPGSAAAVVIGGVTAGRRAGGRARRPGPGRSPGRGLPPAVW